jgi:hypothetical protein
VEIKKPNVLWFQESMAEGKKVVGSVGKLLRYWECLDLEVEFLFGRDLIG